MDYKRIFKSRSVRLTILNLLGFIPDKLMIKIQYRIKTGRKLNLKNPQRYTEKLQWYKLNCRDQLMKECVNKYLVRDYVKRQELDFLLVDCYGLFDSFKQIDFTILPSQFVVKDTLGGGGNSVYIVKDKNKLDYNDLKSKCDSWMKKYGLNRKNPGREWPYENQENKIIVEEYIESENGELDDFKFFCFNGKVSYIYVITDRKLGDKVSLGIFDCNFNQINAYRKDENRLNKEYKKPINFDKMIKYAEILSRPFSHARIDLYNVDGKIYFGEITFFDGSGYMKYDPDDFDYILGKDFNINNI